MFNNLIESSSHKREFKRRGSFVLFTAATYVLLFVVAGVASIYAYDAQLSDPSSELELISYVPLQEDAVVPQPVRVRNNPPAGAAEGPRSTRPVLIDRADNPLNPPKDVSAVASDIPPANRWTEVGTSVVEPAGGGSPNTGGITGPSGPGNTVVVNTPDPPPQPEPTPRPVARVISKGPVTGLAIDLPKPPYPAIGRQVGAAGPVNVQVLIDETGKVVSAKAVSGHPLLLAAATQAAYRAKFSPTRLGDQAVKVSGVITYNFVLQ
jgi:protein TonB